MLSLGMTDAFLMEVVPAAVAVPPTPALGIWPAGLGFAVYGSTGCEQTPTPQTVVPGYAWTCSANTLGPVLGTCDPEITVDTLEYDTIVCTPPTPKWSLPEPGSTGPAEGETPLFAGMNPLTVGSDLVIMIPPDASEVTVHDVSARTVYASGTESAPVSGEFRIGTGGWPAGVYLVSITRSGIVMREKVVIQAK